MIETFFRPGTVAQAQALKLQYGEQAVYMAGGARLNATPTKTSATIAISLEKLGLEDIRQTPTGWRIGAMARLQALVDHPELPVGLRQAAGLVYSRNIRNQATIAGEIATATLSCQILPALLAMGAELELADGSCVELEQYLTGSGELITGIMIPAQMACCHNKAILPSAVATPIINASIARVTGTPAAFQVALAGVASLPVRLRDIEKLPLAEMSTDEIAKAVSACVLPESDYRASAEYKRHVAGIVVADLINACQAEEVA